MHKRGVIMFDIRFYFKGFPEHIGYSKLYSDIVDGYCDTYNEAKSNAEMVLSYNDEYNSYEIIDLTIK